jgi:ribonuclease HII
MPAVREEAVAVDRSLLPAAIAAQPTIAIAGADEVGRGCLAGPIVVAACLIPEGVALPPIRDSKAMSAKARAAAAAVIRERCQLSIVGIAPAEIDALGINEANRLAFERALRGLAGTIDAAIVDGLLRLEGLPYPVISVVAGERFLPVAAASIVAKEYRDALMAAIDAAHPGRGFASAGYPSPANIEALRRHGPTEHHRRSFKVKALHPAA